jgi:hypothetical protein
MSLKYLNKIPTERNGGIPVNIQDQTSQDLALYLGETLDNLTILANTVIDDETIAIETTGVVPTVGNYIFIKEVASFYQAEIITVTPISGNQYTLGISMPLDFAFSVSAVAILQNIDMNVNGSVTKRSFIASPTGLSGIEAWDVNRMIIEAAMSSQPDDGKFCDITALVAGRGMYFRTKDGSTQNLFSARTNGDFKMQGAGDLTYAPKTGGQGIWGMSVRITFNGQEKRGVVKRLFASKEDEFQGWVRADLSAITRFRVMVQGQVVTE